MNEWKAWQHSELQRRTREERETLSRGIAKQICSAEGAMMNALKQLDKTGRRRTKFNSEERVERAAVRRVDERRHLRRQAAIRAAKRKDDARKMLRKDKPGARILLATSERLRMPGRLRGKFSALARLARAQAQKDKSEAERLQRVAARIKANESKMSRMKVRRAEVKSKRHAYTTDGEVDANSAYDIKGDTVSVEMMRAVLKHDQATSRLSGCGKLLFIINFPTQKTEDGIAFANAAKKAEDALRIAVGKVYDIEDRNVSVLQNPGGAKGCSGNTKTSGQLEIIAGLCFGQTTNEAGMDASHVQKSGADRASERKRWSIAAKLLTEERIKEQPGGIAPKKRLIARLLSWLRTDCSLNLSADSPRSRHLREDGVKFDIPLRDMNDTGWIQLCDIPFSAALRVVIADGSDESNNVEISEVAEEELRMANPLAATSTARTVGPPAEAAPLPVWQARTPEAPHVEAAANFFLSSDALEKEFAEVAAARSASVDEEEGCISVSDSRDKKLTAESSLSAVARAATPTQAKTNLRATVPTVLSAFRKRQSPSQSTLPFRSRQLQSRGVPLRPRSAPSPGCRATQQLQTQNGRKISISARALHEGQSATENCASTLFPSSAGSNLDRSENFAAFQQTSSISMSSPTEKVLGISKFASRLREKALDGRHVEAELKSFSSTSSPAVLSNTQEKGRAIGSALQASFPSPLPGPAACAQAIHCIRVPDTCALVMVGVKNDSRPDNLFVAATAPPNVIFCDSIAKDKAPQVKKQNDRESRVQWFWHCGDAENNEKGQEKSRKPREYGWGDKFGFSQKMQGCSASEAKQGDDEASPAETGQATKVESPWKVDKDKRNVRAPVVSTADVFPHSTVNVSFAVGGGGRVGVLRFEELSHPFPHGTEVRMLHTIGPLEAGKIAIVSDIRGPLEFPQQFDLVRAFTETNYGISMESNTTSELKTMKADCGPERQSRRPQTIIGCQR